jgi:hypothetical protein
MSTYALFWERNEITGMWNKSRYFRAVNDSRAVAQAVGFIGDEPRWKLCKVGYLGTVIRVVAEIDNIEE